MVLSLWVTDYCNLNCSYCYINKTSKSEMKIDMQDNIVNFIKSVFNQSDSETLAIKFFGGEPTLNMDFIKEFVKKINIADIPNLKRNIDFLVTTNGTLLDKENIKFFKDNDIKISLSIDGNKRTNSKHRVTNLDLYWDKLENNIDSLLLELPESYARMTFTSETYKYLEENIDYLIEKGFKNIKPIPDYFDEGWTDELFLDLKRISNNLKNKYFNEYKKKGIQITMFEAKDELLKGYIGCSGGYKSFSIASNGDIYPCTYTVKDKKFLLGNIMDYEKFKIRKQVVDHSKRTDCFGCKYFKCCDSGRCIYINYKSTGDFYKPNGFFCAYTKLAMELNQ